MKNLFSIFVLIFAVLSLSNCRGPEGPEGLPGPKGDQGPEGEPGPMGILYEVEYTLTPSNTSYFFPFPAADLPLIYPEDVVLVYLLVDVVENQAGEEIDVWRLLPYIDFEDEGIFTLNYDYTLEDVIIYYDANYELSAETEYNFISRIVVFPAIWGTHERSKESINFENYNEVIQALGIEDTKAKGIPFKRR